MSWKEELAPVPQHVKDGIKRHLRNEDVKRLRAEEDKEVIDELSREPQPIPKDNDIRQYRGQLLSLAEKLGTALDKFDMAELQNQDNFRYRQEIKNIVGSLEEVTRQLKQEVL